jgi:hypothetical protein
VKSFLLRKANLVVRGFWEENWDSLNSQTKGEDLEEVLTDNLVREGLWVGSNSAPALAGVWNAWYSRLKSRESQLNCCLRGLCTKSMLDREDLSRKGAKAQRKPLERGSALRLCARNFLGKNTFRAKPLASSDAQKSRDVETSQLSICI